MDIGSDPVTEPIRIQSHPSGGFVLRIGQAAMTDRLPIFEQAGSYSNGPAWGALIEYVVATDPRMSDYHLDAEGRGWCKTREPLERLRAILLEVTADAARLQPLILAARAAGFGQGDL